MRRQLEDKKSTYLQKKEEEKPGLEFSISTLENIDLPAQTDSISLRVSILIDKSLMIVDDRP
jgi:hypothetical protein